MEEVRGTVTIRTAESQDTWQCDMVSQIAFFLIANIDFFHRCLLKEIIYVPVDFLFLPQMAFQSVF